MKLFPSSFLHTLIHLVIHHGQQLDFSLLLPFAGRGGGGFGGGEKNGFLTMRGGEEKTMMGGGGCFVLARVQQVHFPSRNFLFLIFCGGTRKVTN